MIIQIILEWNINEKNQNEFLLLFFLSHKSNYKKKKMKILCWSFFFLWNIFTAIKFRQRIGKLWKWEKEMSWFGKLWVKLKNIKKRKKLNENFITSHHSLGYRIFFILFQKKKKISCQVESILYGWYEFNSYCFSHWK